MMLVIVFALLSVRGQPVELCPASEIGCCQACCSAGENAPELPGFVDRGGCKNGCDNVQQDCNNLNIDAEENRQSCEMGKSFCNGETSLFFGQFVCCLSDATLGFDNIAGG